MWRMKFHMEFVGFGDVEWCLPFLLPFLPSFPIQPNINNPFETSSVLLLLGTDIFAVL